MANAAIDGSNLVFECLYGANLHLPACRWICHGLDGRLWTLACMAVSAVARRDGTTMGLETCACKVKTGPDVAVSPCLGPIAHQPHIASASALPLSVGPLWRLHLLQLHRCRGYPELPGLGILPHSLFAPAAWLPPLPVT